MKLLHQLVPTFLFLAVSSVAVAFPQEPSDSFQRLEYKTDSLGLKFVCMRPSAFLMGSNGQSAKSVEKPVHNVTITKEIDFGVFEISVSQFRQFVERTGYVTEAEKGGIAGYGVDPESMQLDNGRQYTWRNVGFPQTDDCPVVNVTWFDANAFCKWCSKNEKVRYRLPTEAEWERACRAGKSSEFAHGEVMEQVVDFANVADLEFSRLVAVQGINVANRSDGFAFSAPCGRFPKNRLGIHDMNGNVREWCYDWFGDYSNDVGKRDPDGAIHSVFRSARGGSWLSSPTESRCSARNYLPPEECDCDLGFRVVRESQ